MLRPTLRVFPANPELERSAELPWGFCVTPLARLSSESAGVPCCSSPLPRCHSCGAYMSSLSPIDYEEWMCVICGEQCPVPSSLSTVPTSLEAHVMRAAGLRHPCVEICPADSGAETANSPAFVFLVDGRGSAAFLQCVCSSIEYVLSAAGSETLFGLALLVQRSVIFFDSRGPSWRSHPLAEFSPELDTPSSGLAISASQWLVPCSKGRLRHNVVRFLTSAACASSEFSSINSTTVADAIHLLTDMFETSQISSSRLSVLLDIQSSTDLALMGSCTVTIDGDDDGIAYWRHQEGQDFEFQPTTAVEQGCRAADLGLVIDLHLISSAKDPSPLAFSIIGTVQESGGTIIIHRRADSEMLDKVCNRLAQPVGLHGLLRLRTTPGYFVQCPYGANVRQDDDVEQVFHLIVGHGRGSTVFLELNFSGSAGFLGNSEGPYAQLAFRCVWAELGSRVRQVLRVHTVTLPVTTSVRTIWMSADIPSILMAVVHKIATIRREYGSASAQKWIIAWLVRMVSKDRDTMRILRNSVRHCQADHRHRHLICQLEAFENPDFGQLARLALSLLFRGILALLTSEMDYLSEAWVATSDLGALDPDNLVTWIQSKTVLNKCVENPRYIAGTSVRKSSLILLNEVVNALMGMLIS
jgi:Sec23/Sec24 zinc finger